MSWLITTSLAVIVLAFLYMILVLAKAVKILTHRLQNLEKHTYGQNYDRYKGE